MNKAASIFRRILKAIIWIILSVVLLFIIIAILIRIPAVQTKVSRYAISFISKKTHTRVELDRINISFPKTVVIAGLYLEDTQKDTLFYAGEARINIALRNLINQKIHISSFRLEDANINLTRRETDSLFNFNFLLTAFTDTLAPKKVVEKPKTAWTIRIDEVELKRIRLHFGDEYGGMDVAARLENGKIRMDQIDPANSVYKINEILIDSLTAMVVNRKLPDPDHKEPAGAMPLITADKIKINNSSATYADSIGQRLIIAGIRELELKKSEIDLGADLRIKIRQIDLDGNSLIYRNLGKTLLTNAFDANNLDYENIILTASDLDYSSAKTEVRVRKFTASGKDGFSILQFQTDFSMDPQSISAKNLLVKTNNSSIDADLNLRYSSLGSLKDSLQTLIVNAEVRSAIIRNSDITYFYPPLKEQSFFKNGLYITTVSGTINGAINNLKGKNLVVTTGDQTILKTDFTITGLPDIKTATFYFPNLKIDTGRKDVEMIAGPSIPDNIALPEKINLKIIFAGQLKAFKSTLVLASSYGAAHIIATIDRNENFTSKATLTDFDLGKLLKDTAMFGPVSLTAETSGHGFDKNTIQASIKAEASKIHLNQYVYHNLKIDGKISGQAFEGKINLNDENAVFDFDGLVNLNPTQEQYEFRLNVPGIDLKKLHFTKKDIRVGLMAEASLTGGNIQKVNGRSGITNIIIISEGNKYMLDSLLFISFNGPDKSDLNLTSSLVGIKYNGTFSPVELPRAIIRFLNNYFPFSDAGAIKKNVGLAAFTFEIQLQNHPILSEVFLPQLKEFEPGLIQGSFDESKNELKFDAAIRKLVYGTTVINDFKATIDSDVTALNYKVSSNNISNAKIKLDNFIIEGKLADQAITAGISSIDEKLNKKLSISSRIIKQDGNFRVILDPEDFFLMNDRWDIAADNFIEFGKKGFLIHRLFLSKTESQINISSVNDRFNDDLSIAIKNFRLDDVSRIIEKDTSLVKGKVDGNVLLKRIDSTYGIIADAQISNLLIRDIPIGNITLQASNPTSGKFDLDVKLSGPDNNLTANGFYIPGGGDNSISINAAIQSLSMKTLEAFSMGQLTEGAGAISGNLLIEGRSDAPDLTGELVFNNTFIKPTVLNNRLELKNETITFKKEGIYFNSFTISDMNQHIATIDGTVLMKQFKDLIFNLQVKSQNFLLLNTTPQNNKQFNGKLIIGSTIDIKGPMALPVVNARVKIKKGSNFTFAVPDDKLTTDKGEDVVEFNDPTILHPILAGGMKKKAATKSGVTGVDLTAIVEVEKQATLKLLLDPSSTDSLVVRGEAALSFALDRSGKMSLTGAYNLDEGSYLITLESVIKRKFAIVPGSTINWNGDPLDAEVSINAIYTVRAAPYDLVADQMTGLSNVDKGGYKQRYPFLVMLKLRGELLHPLISFEIQLEPENKGILGGAVNQKLAMLNEDESALNKQVFALLVLGRFIQENPLQTESTGASTLVRSTVGKFLSAQLNQLSSKFIPGVELNFDIQSYDDFQTGEAQGRTQVEIGMKKQLFNERLSVQLGGTVDVEGDRAKQNSASDITSDVNVEYKFTKDGRFRLEAFRHNQYEGAFEGQLVETGVGVLYVRDFNKWKELFKKPEPKPGSSRKNKLP